MKKLSWRLAAGLLLVSPTAGCLQSLSLNFLEPNGPTTGASSKASPDELPPKATAEVCVQLGESFEQRGFIVEAALQFEKARSLNSRLKHLNRRLAVLYARAGETQKAIAEFQAALKVTPKDEQLLNDFGYCYYAAGRWTEAEEQFRKAVATDKKLARGWVNLGMCLAQQERYPEALEAFQKGSSPAEAQANLAFILSTQGKKDEAAETYRKALELNPNLPVARAALAKLENPAPAKSPVAGAPTANATNDSPTENPANIRPEN